MKKIITMVVFIFISSLLIAEEVESVENVIPQEVIESNVINFKFDSIKMGMSTKEFLKLYPKATTVDSGLDDEVLFYRTTSKSAKDVVVAAYAGKIYAILVSYSEKEIDRLGGSIAIGYKLMEKIGFDKQIGFDGDHIMYIWFFRDIDYSATYTLASDTVASFTVRNDKVFREIQTKLREEATSGFEE